MRGSAHNMAGVIDARTGERFNCDAGAGRPRGLLPAPGLPTKQRSADLRPPYSAGLVDMEAAAIARLAAMRGIPFYCIKGVSDGLTDHLPDFNRFIDPSGHFQTGRFALYALLMPWYWPALIRMGENSKRASQSIAESLRDFLDE